jgi:hypothetical protein
MRRSAINASGTNRARVANIDRVSRFSTPLNAGNLLRFEQRGCDGV